MQKITEQEALQRLTLLCSQAEHCQKEMHDKMEKWELTPEEQARIMQYLINEKYIDDTRYCRGYIHDKMAYNHWGRRKIEQMLWTKDIPRSISDPLFEKEIGWKSVSQIFELAPNIVASSIFILETQLILTPDNPTLSAIFIQESSFHVASITG